MLILKIGSLMKYLEELSLMAELWENTGKKKFKTCSTSMYSSAWRRTTYIESKMFISIAFIGNSGILLRRKTSITMRHLMQEPYCLITLQSLKRLWQTRKKASAVMFGNY
jgi:hypothetical protein